MVTGVCGVESCTLCCVDSFRTGGQSVMIVCGGSLEVSANRECVYVVTVAALFRRCTVGSRELVENSLFDKTAGALGTFHREDTPT